MYVESISFMPEPTTTVNGCAAGLDAGGLVASVVAAEVRFAERAQQIAQRAKAEEVEPLVGDLEARLPAIILAGVTDLSTGGELREGSCG